MLKAQNQTIKITTKENRSYVKHLCHNSCMYGLSIHNWDRPADS